MNSRTSIFAASFAAFLGMAAASAAQAETKGYVVSLFAPAMNNNDDTDCPQGKNPIAPEILAGILKNEGKTPAEIEKIMGPGVFNGQVFAQYATMRGRIDGQPVNVYQNPLSVPDPNIKLSVAKEAFGFNLDGKDGAGQYVDPLTKEAGVDNAASRVFGCFDRTRGTLEQPPINWSVRWNYYSYGNSWLIELNKPSGDIDFKNDDGIEVTFYRGVQPPTKNTQGYQRDVTYNIDDNPRTSSKTFKGKIKDGLFVSDEPIEFTMLGSPRMHPVFNFKNAKLRMQFKPDGSFDGFLGGYLPITMIYFPFGDYGAAAEFNGGMDVAGVYYALRKEADTDIDLDTKTGVRTRISQTYLVRGVPAFLVRPTTGNAGSKSRRTITVEQKAVPGRS